MSVRMGIPLKCIAVKHHGPASTSGDDCYEATYRFDAENGLLCSAELTMRFSENTKDQVDQSIWIDVRPVAPDGLTAIVDNPPTPEPKSPENRIVATFRRWKKWWLDPLEAYERLTEEDYEK